MSVSGTPKLSVLYLDQDPDAFNLLRSHFNQHPEFSTRFDHAGSTQELSEKVKAHNYQMVLIDSLQDLENTVSLLQQLKNLKVNLPFVLLTSIHDDRLVREARQFGVADVIVKNELHYQELLEVLRTVSENSQQEKNKPKEQGAVMSEPDSQTPIPSDSAGSPEDSSIRDNLTGVYNHSYLFERMVEEFNRAKRHSYPVACLVLDIDHFKGINEKWNHRVGDQLLKESVGILMENCRLSDFIARYGGEEFAILMPYTDYSGAMELASRLKNAFAEHQFLAHAENINMTISVGISAFPEDIIEKRSELLSFAIQALYRSKASGRNRVTLYRDIVPIFGKDDLPSLKISEDKILEFQRKISEIASAARRNYIEAAKAMIMALESKDRFTAGHAGTCAKYSMQIAEAMGMSLDEAEIIEHAALLHDIGKICIPDNILLKPEKLTFAEFETMRQHPYLGYKMLKPLKFLDREAQLVLHHHEWWNGEGYPCRLKGNEIPLGSRIIAVADSYDTMRSAGGRYKKTVTLNQAVKELIVCSGIQFDPRAVKAFIQVLKIRGELLNDDYDQEHLEKLIREIEEADAASEINKHPGID